MHVSARRLLPVLTALFLLACLLAATVESWHWPLVGDASLMHYVVFLIERGWAPYRQILDINLPGSYFFEAAGMRLFGGGAIGWRIYDLLLLTVCGLSAFAIVPRRDWFAAAFAFALFCLIHIEDGLEQLGQRDLLVAALLAGAYALALMDVRNLAKIVMHFIAGVLIGAAVIVKPLYLPFVLLLAGASAYKLRRRPVVALAQAAAMLAGLVLPSATAFVYLHEQHAIFSFWQILTGLIPVHASLGRGSISYLVSRSLSRIGPLCALWIATIAIARPKFSPARVQLILAALISAFGYFAQGKGYQYHRYPLLFFLLLLIGWDFVIAARTSGIARIPAIAGLALGCFFIAPQATWKIHSFEIATPFQSALAYDLTELGGRKLSDHIQCLDTFGGCINTLYDLKLVQSSGFLYDCYLFTPAQGKVTAGYRDAFWNSYQDNPPSVIVMTSQFCFGPDDFHKLDNWPAFHDELDRSYKLKAEWVPRQPEHWWSRKQYPASFRIYLRKAVPGGN